MSIEEWVIPNTGAEFKGSDFRDWCKPGVYVLLDKQGLPLYVGMGKNGVLRAAQRTLVHVRREWAFSEYSTLKLFPCVSVEAAKKLETHLIGILQPVFNDRLKTLHIARLLGIQRISYAKINQA